MPASLNVSPSIPDLDEASISKPIMLKQWAVKIRGSSERSGIWNSARTARFLLL